MNKGIELSSGRWLWFLGTGDVPVDGAIDRVLEAIKLDSESDMHCFCVRCSLLLNQESLIFLSPTSSELKWRNTLHHQGVIYRKNSIDKYDTRFKVLADYHMNLKL